MKLKKKLSLILAIVTILLSISSIALAEPIHAPPSPIRDSIVEEF